MLKKILDSNIKKTYIIINQPVDNKIYDDLYEQFFDEEHSVWKKFREVNSVETINKEKLSSTANRNKDEYVGYWFFKQRTDNRSTHIQINGKNHPYRPNCMIIMHAGDKFKVINTEGPRPEMLVSFVYFREQDQKKIKELLFPLG
jgi:hypothetical protein